MNDTDQEHEQDQEHEAVRCCRASCGLLSKSALIGLGAGVLITLGIAAASSPGSVGHYQIAGTGNHGLIIDTVTGQVWSGYFLSSQGKTDADFFQPKIGEKK